MYEVINADCIDALEYHVFYADMIFADPPDNLGLEYNTCRDNMLPQEYAKHMLIWLTACIESSPTVWWSFNAKHTPMMGKICDTIQGWWPGIEIKPCVQTYTFYQHNSHDLGNAHRPLWRFRQPIQNAPLYPDQVRIPSWRQLHGDARANPKGKVPGDVLDFPRVTGNSRQRRSWCPTQLHEDLVARCIQLCTRPGGSDLVFDPFAGSGTTMRVCKKLGRNCVVSDIDPHYCEMIAREHGLEVTKLPERSD